MYQYLKIGKLNLICWHLIISLNIIDTVWPKYNHGVPMVYGDYETHYDDDDGEGYHVYEDEPIHWKEM